MMFGSNLNIIWYLANHINEYKRGGEYVGQRFGTRPSYEDYNLEIADELTPDPFSDEPHSIAHKSRLKLKKILENNTKIDDNKRD